MVSIYFHNGKKLFIFRFDIFILFSYECNEEFKGKEFKLGVRAPIEPKYGGK